MDRQVKSGIRLLAVAFISASILTGCGENPLKSLSDEKKIDVLAQANVAAKKEFSYKEDFFSSGFYQACLQGKETESFCKKYYSAMVKAMKPLVGRVNTSDITDNEVIEPVIFQVTRKSLRLIREDQKNSQS